MTGKRTSQARSLQAEKMLKYECSVSAGRCNGFVPEKILIPPQKFLLSALGCPKVVGGLTSNLLCGEGMDVFLKSEQPWVLFPVYLCLFFRLTRTNTQSCLFVIFTFKTA